MSCLEIFVVHGELVESIACIEASFFVVAIERRGQSFDAPGTSNFLVAGYGDSKLAESKAGVPIEAEKETPSGVRPSHGMPLLLRRDRLTHVVSQSIYFS